MGATVHKVPSAIGLSRLLPDEALGVFDASVCSFLLPHVPLLVSAPCVTVFRH